MDPGGAGAESGVTAVMAVSMGLIYYGHGIWLMKGLIDYGHGIWLRIKSLQDTTEEAFGAVVGWASVLGLCNTDSLSNTSSLLHMLR